VGRDATEHDTAERDAAERDSENIIEGRNTVIEAIKANVAIDKVYIINEESDASMRFIASSARAAGAVVVNVDKRKLDAMSVTRAHQGVIAIAACTPYKPAEDIVGLARQRGEAPLIVICDEISDPHNLGAIIRTCEASGAHGIIIPKRRSAGLTATVAKASSGAVYHVPVARVTNLNATISELKKAGVWIYGAASGGGTPLWEVDFSGPAAIVIGSEGSGIARLVAENCDVSVSIPMFGKISSLNASVSAAIILYEVVRQRRV
jgi:23S rRNA (guanosine2251-2'-O)-methyltransferase